MSAVASTEMKEAKGSLDVMLHPLVIINVRFALRPHHQRDIDSYFRL